MLFNAFILISSSNSLLSSLVYMFDLERDPNECIDVTNHESYQTLYSYFMERKDYWLNYTLTSNAPNSTKKAITWKNDCNDHVCPWIDVTFTPTEIEQRYSYEDAPNIVFILVDDWGYNDFGLRSTYMNWTTPTLDRLAQEGKD